MLAAFSEFGRSSDTWYADCHLRGSIFNKINAGTYHIALSSIPPAQKISMYRPRYQSHANLALKQNKHLYIARHSTLIARVASNCSTVVDRSRVFDKHGDTYDGLIIVSATCVFEAVTSGTAAGSPKGDQREEQFDRTEEPADPTSPEMGCCGCADEPSSKVEPTVR